MIPKFRAWDKINKLMLEVMLIDFKQRKVIGEHFQFGKTDNIPFDDVEIMQSTGICDKRGVKIFEKDIVKFSIDNGFEYICDEIGFVYYCLGAYRILNGLDETLINTNAYLISDIDKIEVIGNIYENPELLDV